MNKKITLYSLTVAVNLFFAVSVLACPPPLPTAVLKIKPAYAITGKPVLLDGHSSSCAMGRSIVQYQWDWTNDGRKDYAETPSGHTDGIFDGNTTYTYTAARKYTVKLWVIDNLNAADWTTADVNVSPDSDGDNMPDAWEAKYGITDPNTDLAADKDNDGSSNLREYLCGTNPSDPNSKYLGAITIKVPSQVATIRAAIEAAREGDTVDVDSGTYCIVVGHKN